jgi:hypothetical protein
LDRSSEVAHLIVESLHHGVVRHPVRAFPSSIFLDKNRRDIGESQSTWTDSKMETARSPLEELVAGVGLVVEGAASGFGHHV